MKKFFKISGIIFSFLLLVLVFMLLFPFLFKDKFAELVKNTARKSLRTEMNFVSMNVSFFHHFPNLTISLTDFYLKSSAPFSQDTLVRARDISFGVDLMSLFKGPVRISKVYVRDGRVILKYNEKGLSGFDVVKTSSDTLHPADTTSAGTANLKIEDISFRNTDFVYSDMSIPLKILFHGMNYRGNSDITNDILLLQSKIQIDSIDFSYNNVSYIKSKPLKADLVTSIDLNTLDMKFEKNDLIIKDIPFEFRGEMNFKKNGYSLFVSLYSTFQDEWFSGSVYLVDFQNMWIAVKSDINLKLENWTRRLDVKDMDLKGNLRLKLNTQGYYITGPDPHSPKHDTVILSVPDYTLSSTLRNGYFKLKDLPQGISNISFDLESSVTNHDYHKLQANIENLRANFLKNNIEGYFRIKGFDDLPLESKISAKVNLAEIGEVIPLDSLTLTGMMNLELLVNGKYAPSKKLFPESEVLIDITDGSIKTKYYPRPVEKIGLHASVTNKTGDLAGTKINLQELSFLFEGNPFLLKGTVVNPDNADYKIIAKGTIDVARMYKVFSQEGMELDGVITADLNLQGRQSDAMNGRLDKLHNTGSLGLRKIALKTDYLPLKLILQSGLFRFDNDKIWFDKFDSRYGKSDIVLNGNLSNVVNYFLSKNQVLKGEFDFTSGYILVDEFMKPSSGPSTTGTTSSSGGVIIIPSDLDILLKADLKRINFEKTEISDFLATLEMKQGALLLRNMNFNIIGCKASMEASYMNAGKEKASFDFHVKADDFDVKRAYNELELFRNIASSAGKCEGIVSLDYSLKGKLDAGMSPIYPSLEGGGVLSLKKVKVMGLKLFTEMSKNLDKGKIKNPDLTKVELKTTIKNNIITLEQTKMKIAGFRFRVSGESSFDGQLNLKTRLGLPPLGIIGIPIRVLGTMENPKFKYGRGNNDENLEESVYSDEIPPDLLEKIKNSKEEEDGDDR